MLENDKGSGETHTHEYMHVFSQRKRIQLMGHCIWDGIWQEIDGGGWLNWGRADINIHNVCGHNEGETEAAGGHIQG